MIKAIIFDVGGVIVRSGNRPARSRWEKRLGLEEWESENIIFNSEMGHKAQLGEIGDADLWNWAKSALHLSDEQYPEFVADFWSDNQVDDEMMASIRALRSKYTTAIISNATETLRQDLEERYQIADAFDLIVCSAEEKVMKPNPEIYIRTLERLEIEPSEGIFVDDMKTNVTAAEVVGLKAIQYTPGIDLITEFRNYGVSTGG